MESWVEKYRPVSLNNIISQDLTISHLQSLIEKGDIPHLIFTGSPGTGKTSSALSFISDLFKKYYSNISNIYDWIFLRNASDDLRASKGDLEDLKEFIYSDGVSDKNGFKFVVLEESDRMSDEVQGSLRRMMELCPPNVRFIFTNNYVENLIEPIISRCSVYRFYPIPKIECINTVTKILSIEGTSLSDKEIELIYHFSRGDLRKIINNAQIISKNQTESNLYDFFGIFTETELNNILQNMKNDYLSLMNFLSKKNISPESIIYQLFDYFIENAERYDDKIEDIILCIDDFDRRFLYRTDKNLQMKALFSKISLILRGEKID